MSRRSPIRDPFRGKIGLMPTTLQLDMAAVRDVANRVVDVVGLLTLQSIRLRLPTMPPATDALTIRLSRGVSVESRRLAYLLEAAADELGRALEAILAYAHDGAALARRTELALMGLEIGEFEPSSEPSIRRSPRTAGTPTPPPGVADDLHGALSQALLLAQGADLRAQSPVDVTQLRAAATALHASARTLRAAMSSGDRPAAMLDRFGGWLETDAAGAAAQLNSSVARWATAYESVREQVQEPAALYRGWLAAAVAGADRDAVDLSEAAAHCRAALREYASTSISEISCLGHPLLGTSA